jgi:hypothetical protein
MFLQRKDLSLDIDSITAMKANLKKIKEIENQKLT